MDDSTQDQLGSDSETNDSKFSHQRGKKRRDNQHGWNKCQQWYSSASGSRIKPIPPKEYNGAADVRAYHWFVRESDAYLWDGKVRGQQKVFLLSYYLTDKAYNFYTQKVTIDKDHWTVSQFYKELFNYCFPIDYRMQLWKTLARCHQNDKTIAKYTHKLQDLFNMIGSIQKQEQVLKFWNSTRPSIQKELWQNKLNPELSSWREVVTQAEIIKIAENVAECRDRRSGQSSQVSGAASGSGRSSSKIKNQPVDRSVRAVTFGSWHKTHGKHGKKLFHQAREGSQRGSTSHSQSGTSTGKGKFKSGSVPPNAHQHRPSQPWWTPQLSDKEKSEYRAARRCFSYGKEGHMSRNCPDNAAVCLQGQGPPEPLPSAWNQPRQQKQTWMNQQRC